MTKTIFYTAASLDGFIADAANSLDWLHQFEDVEGNDYGQFIDDIGALAMGSTTYQWVLDNHVRPGTPEEQPWPYTQPAWVFSSRDLPAINGADIRFVRGDVRPVHAEMVRAAAGKNIWIVGGGDLAGQFYDHGLLDELIITVAPVTLGGGAPLLPRPIASPPLRLFSAAPWSGGTFVRLHYQVQKRSG
ncbi:MAG: dihydrofolate reductase family protein [Caldilineales bacterium]